MLTTTCFMATIRKARATIYTIVTQCAIANLDGSLRPKYYKNAFY